MGDAGFVAESAMATALRPVDVLKVGHTTRIEDGDQRGFSVALTRPQAAISRASGEIITATRRRKRSIA